MSRKSFWNWLGLPSYADIQALQEASQRQEIALTSLMSINAETKMSLATIQADLLASVEQMDSTNRNMLDAAEKSICETIQAGINHSHDLLSGQVTELAHETLLTLKSELGTSAEQINQSNKAVAADVEKRICDAVQAWAEKSHQLLASHIQAVTEQSIAVAKAELAATMEQTSKKNQEAMDSAEYKISSAIRMCTEDSQRILSKQADKLAKNIDTLAALCETTYSLDNDTQERVGHIITECRTQNELLRMLLANTLIDDIAQKFPKGNVSAGSMRGNR